MNRQPTPNEILADIRAHCLDCMGGSRKMVRQCTSAKCHLWKYRMENASVKAKKDKNQITIFEYLREAQ